MHQSTVISADCYLTRDIMVNCIAE